jgi:hypothetical protein
LISEKDSSHRSKEILIVVGEQMNDSAGRRSSPDVYFLAELGSENVDPSK